MEPEKGKSGLDYLRYLIISVLTGIILGFAVGTIPQTAFTYALVVSALVFLLTYSGEIWKRIRCDICDGKGKIRCNSCINGYMSPQISSSSQSTDLSKIGDNYILKMTTDGHSRGFAGYVNLQIKVINLYTEEVLGKFSERLFVRRKGSAKKETTFNLGELNYIKEIVGGEPNINDLEIKIKYTPVKGEKCKRCDGRGFIVCPRCNGKRITRTKHFHY